MKIEFEGSTLEAVILQMRDLMDAVGALRPAENKFSENVREAASVLPQGVNPVSGPEGPAQGPEVPEVIPVAETPVDKKSTGKNLDNLAKARAAKQAKQAAAKAAVPKGEEVPADPKGEEVPADPKALAAMRQQTIEELQAAYAKGQQKEVFQLLAKYGNGAKSFRELSADAFPPIRKAIDEGALA